MVLENIQDSFFRGVLKINIWSTKGVLKKDFHREHPIVPDISTLIRLNEESKIYTPWRAAYFMVLVKMLKNCNYVGKIISESNYQFFIDYSSNAGINIMQEIGVLNNWVNKDFDELLSNYLSLLIKISAIERKTGNLLKLSIEFNKEA